MKRILGDLPKVLCQDPRGNVECFGIPFEDNDFCKIEPTCSLLEKKLRLTSLYLENEPYMST